MSKETSPIAGVENFEKCFQQMKAEGFFDKKDESKYYFVSYMHKCGYGNAFWEVFKGELDIRAVETDITNAKNTTGVSVMFVSEITKEQFIDSNKRVEDNTED